MGFALKKFIASFLMPIPLILLAALLGLLFLFRKSYTKAKIFITTSMMMLLLFSNDYFANLYLYPLESQFKKFEQRGEYEYIFVLGSGHDDSVDTPLSSHLSRAAMKRLSEGLMLLEHNANAKLILSGYGGRSESSHAKIASDFAVAMGVDQERIITFDQAKDTVMEAKIYKERVGVENFILVTSATHMPRSIAIFQKIGLNPVAAPTDYLSQSRAKWYSFGAQNINKVEAATHEYLGIVWYKLRGFI